MGLFDYKPVYLYIACNLYVLVRYSKVREIFFHHHLFAVLVVLS